MASWNIYSKNGTLKYTTHQLEYSEEWMVQDLVSVTVTSASPITWEIGDYLTYRGERYSIYSLPSTLKCSRLNTYGEGFKWEDVRFYADSMRLTEIDFHDYVLSDNQIHYTSLPDFSFYAETVDDLVDRLQANVDRVEDGWVFLTPDLPRSKQRYHIDESDESDDAYIESLWHTYYGANGENIDVGEAVTGVAISVSKNKVSEGLAFVKNKFGLNYITKGKVIIIGFAGVEASHLFQYGKGNGLYEIERTADSEQQIVTKLYAYGSDKNLPIRYYAELNLQVFDEVEGIDVIQNDSAAIQVYYTLSLDYSEKYFTNNSTISWMDFSNKHEVKLSAGNYEITAAAYKLESGDDKRIRIACVHSYNHDYGAGSEPSAEKLLGFMNAVSVGTTVYFTGYVEKTAFPSTNRTYATDNLPNNMAVNVLMLPGFPTYALSELCKSEYDSVNDKTVFSFRKTPTSAYNTFMEVAGSHLVTFSNDRLQPYIVSPNASTLGIKEGNIHFTEETDENGLQEVFPSIEGMTAGDVFGTSSTERLDEVSSATTIEDNGVYGEGEISNFDIILKNLGFDLKKAYNEGGGSMTISMKDGYCGGREFNVKSVTEQSGGTWKLNCERVHDESLDLYFPYSYNASIGQTPVADEAYQVRQGDHFVLLGIEIDDTDYIQAASVKALRKAITWLLNNDYMRYTYLPKIDEIKMARERDEAEAQNRTSLYEWIKCGMRMHFSDSDLDIDASIFIDKLTIHEGDNPVPTFDVTLRNDKQVGTLERITNQITSIISGGAGGLSQGQIESIIERYGASEFLSKRKDDTAQGTITFKKKDVHEQGARFGAGGEIDAHGDATLHNVDASGNVIVDGKVEVSNDTSEGNIVAKFGDTADSMLNGRGTLITDDGRLQTTTMEVRGTLKVLDLVASQIHSLNGYYYFTDTMKIESVEDCIVTESTEYDRDIGDYVTTITSIVFADESDESDDSSVNAYLLTFEKEHENDFLKFYDNDVLLSIMTDLSPASVSRDTNEAGNAVIHNVTSQSWMRVIMTSEDDEWGTYFEDNPDTQGLPRALVAIYQPSQVPGNTNNPPQAGYYVARRGNADTSTQVMASRQNSWCISVEEGRLVYYINQTSPSTGDENYAIAIGKLPDITPVSNLGLVGDIGIYAKNLLVERMYTVDWVGDVKYLTIDMGEWNSTDAANNTYYYKKQTTTVGSDSRVVYTRCQVTHNGSVWQTVQKATNNNANWTQYITTEPKLTNTEWVRISGATSTTIYYTTSETKDLDEGGVGMGSDVPYWRTDQSFFLKEYLDESDVSDASDEGLNPWYYCEFRPFMWRKSVMKTGSDDDTQVVEAPHIIGVFGETGRNYIINTNFDYIPLDNEDNGVEKTLTIETFVENGGVRAEFDCYAKVIKVAADGTSTILHNDEQYSSLPASHAWKLEDIEILPTDVAIEIYINSNGVNIQNTYIAKKEIIILKAAKGDKGDKGDTGLAGPITRVFQNVLSVGQVFCTGTGTGNNAKYKDYVIVGYPQGTVASGYMVYECIYCFDYMGDSDKDLSIMTPSNLTAYLTGSGEDSLKQELYLPSVPFQAVSLNAVSAFFTYLIAQNAYIRMLTGSNFVITDNSGNVLAGMGNMTDSNGNKYYLWSGGENADNATFKVFADGTLDAMRGNFSGFVLHRTTILHEHNIKNFTIREVSAFSGNYENTIQYKILGQSFAFYETPSNNQYYYGGSSDGYGNDIAIYPIGYGDIDDGLPVGTFADTTIDGTPVVSGDLYLNLPFFIQESSDLYGRSQYLSWFKANNENNVETNGLGLYKRYKNDPTATEAQMDAEVVVSNNTITQGIEWLTYLNKYIGDMCNDARELIGTKITILFYGKSVNVSLKVRGVCLKGVDDSASNMVKWPYQIYEFGVDDNIDKAKYITFECKEITYTMNSGATTMKMVAWEVSDSYRGYYDRYTLGLPDITT